MHDDEVDIDVNLVRRLIASQHAQWSTIRIAPVTPRGTDNALFRLGDDMVVRFPRHAVSVPALEKEIRWLPRIAPHLPLAVPVPLAIGTPAEGFPFSWAVYRWLDGEPAIPERITDAHRAALDLAAFISALERLEPIPGPPPGGRGGPLAARDERMRRAISALGLRIDADAVQRVWEDALAAPTWNRPGQWLHGDLDARNVLASQGKLSGIVDFGSMAVGDPACDVMVAWKMVPASLRKTFRRALGADDPTWRRARGWVMSHALIALTTYTRENNAPLVDEAWRWYREVLADRSS